MELIRLGKYTGWMHQTRKIYWLGHDPDQDLEGLGQDLDHDLGWLGQDLDQDLESIRQGKYTG